MTEEAAVWKLEHDYWEYVKAVDLENYRALWHPNFVGWPHISAEPKRKEHVTGWISACAAQGLRLKSAVIEPAASQSTGDLVVVHYRVTLTWIDSNGRGEPETSRIHHTWMKAGTGWQIIAGMSAPEPSPPR